MNGKSRFRKESIFEGAEGFLLESVLENYAEYYSVELAKKVMGGYLFDDYALITCNFQRKNVKITLDDIENVALGLL